MVEITRCDEHEKNGRTYYHVHFFDVDSGSAGNCFVSKSYLERLTLGVSEGKTLNIGYDRKARSNFLYLK